MTATLAFAAGTAFGIVLMLALWKWAEAPLERDDRKDLGDME
jgi:HAMP domain-containing protein